MGFFEWLDLLFSDLKETFFTPEFGEYEHFTVPDNLLLTVRRFAMCLVIAVVFCSFYSVFMRKKQAKLLKKLREMGCVDGETALTLEELGFRRDFILRRQLKGDTLLSSVVHSVRKDALPPEQKPMWKPDFRTEKFYIPDEMKYRADVRFTEKGFSYRVAVLLSVAVLIVAGAVCTFLPQLLSLADWLIGIAF